MQDEDRPLVGVEPAEPALELIAVGKIQARVGFRGLAVTEAWISMLPSPFRTPCFAIAGSDEQAVEPGVEAVGVAETGDVDPGGDERLLGRILGLLLVAEDQPGDDVESVDRDACQLIERIPIPRHRPFHEIPLHRASGRCTTSVVVSLPMSGGQGLTVPNSPSHAIQRRSGWPTARGSRRPRSCSASERRARDPSRTVAP